MAAAVVTLGGLSFLTETGSLAADGVAAFPQSRGGLVTMVVRRF